MIDLFLNLNTCYNRWPPRTRINVKTRSPSSEFASPLAHTVTAILDCHSLVHFNSFHTLWSQESDHRSLFFGVFNQQNNEHLPYAKIKNNSYCLYAPYFSVLTNTTSLSLPAFISFFVCLYFILYLLDQRNGGA